MTGKRKLGDFVHDMIEARRFRGALVVPLRRLAIYLGDNDLAALDLLPAIRGHAGASAFTGEMALMKRRRAPCGFPA